jgi:hypothetical protein
MRMNTQPVLSLWLTLIVLAGGCAHPLAYVPLFPCDRVPGEYVPGSSLESLDANVVSAHLRTLGEPVLHRSALAPSRTIRLTFIGSKRRLLSLRFEQRSVGDVHLHAARANLSQCPRRYRFVAHLVNDEAADRKISPSEWDEVLRLSSALLDEAPLREPGPLPSEEITLQVDGGSIFLEDRDTGGYRAILRDNGSSLTQSDRFARLCNYLVQLSPLSIDPARGESYCPTARAEHQNPDE